MNISIDALKGVYRELDMARILLILGEYDDAIAKLDILLRQPSFISIELLKADPFWDPLRKSESFNVLIEDPRSQI